MVTRRYTRNIGAVCSLYFAWASTLLWSFKPQLTFYTSSYMHMILQCGARSSFKYLIINRAHYYSMWYLVITMTWSVKECLPIMKASCVHFVPWDSIASDVHSTRGNPHRIQFYFKLAPIFAFCPLLLAIFYASAVLFYYCCILYIGVWGKDARSAF
jgi:hypothetical protein